MTSRGAIPVHFLGSNDAQTPTLKILSDRLVALGSAFQRGRLLTEEDAEETQPLGSCVVLAPGPTVIKDEKVADELLDCPTVRLLLSNPAIHVLMVTSSSWKQMRNELARWLKVAVASSAAGLEPVCNVNPLRSDTPLHWSFLTADESAPENNDAFAKFADTIAGCASQAIYDPTGIRRLVRAIVTGRIENDTPPTVCLAYAAAVDDDSESAQRHAYFARRLGYNAVAVETTALYNLVVPQSNEKSHWFGNRAPDLILMDEELFFGGANVYGSNLLKYWLGPVRIRVTGGKPTEHEASLGVVTFKKPLLDIHDLCARCAKTLPAVTLRVSTPASTKSSYSHPRFLKHLRTIGRNLRRQAEHPPEQVHGYSSALCWLELYELLQDFDGPLAALAYSKVQELEVRELCDTYVPSQEPLVLLRQRAEAVRADLGECANVPPELLEQWVVRIYRAYCRILGERNMPYAFRSQASHLLLEAEDQLMAEHRRPHSLLLRGLFYLWSILRNRLRSLTNSWQRLLGIWFVFYVVFFMVYFWFAVPAVACATEGTPLANRFYQGFFGALAGGFCMPFGDSLGVHVRGGCEAVVNLVHSVISFLLLGRLLNVFFRQTDV